ncbi:hypothetical protein FGO68_gene11079 [Halteria grandinella]|uniref:Uncharacterized protein n=1 Tax=Halteria grandinella TaxID=5974 RepID=A0A8J8T060_HALGN|nr:hypothetical protein FGO68_gene11079 [Halteria grandinella]
MKENLILLELPSESVPYTGAFPRAILASPAATEKQERPIPCDSLKDGESARMGLECSHGRDATSLYTLLSCVKFSVKTLFTINYLLFVRNIYQIQQYSPVCSNMSYRHPHRQRL